MAAQPLPVEQEQSSFYFLVIPGEGHLLKEARWDKLINNLHRNGLTAVGTGPDLDWPLRYESVEPYEVQTVDPMDPPGPFYEVYAIVPLGWDENL